MSKVQVRHPDRDKACGACIVTITYYQAATHKASADIGYYM